jgi:hypothetical protein
VVSSHLLTECSSHTRVHACGCRQSDGSAAALLSAPIMRLEHPTTIWSNLPITVHRRKGLRTGAELADNFTAEVQQARTQGQVFHELRQLRDRFMSTGVYRDVQFAEEPAADGSGGRDLVVELDERAYSLSQGATVGVSGNIVSVCSSACGAGGDWLTDGSLRVGRAREMLATEGSRPCVRRRCPHRWLLDDGARSSGSSGDEGGGLAQNSAARAFVPPLRRRLTPAC